MIDFYVTYIHLLRRSYALLLPSSYVDFIESFIIFYVKLVFYLVPLVKWYSIAIADRRTCCLAAAPISDHCDVAWFLHISAPYIHSTFFQRRTSPPFSVCLALLEKTTKKYICTFICKRFLPLLFHSTTISARQSIMLLRIVEYNKSRL